MLLSVISAVYNAVESLPALVASLRAQTDKGFEWVVADGGSIDGTLEYLRSINDLNIKVIDGPDFGIYDALNKAIVNAEGEYYLTMGSDDVLNPEAIKQYKAAIEENGAIDLVTASVLYAGKICKPVGRFPWFYGQFSYISMHSVGLLVRRRVHNEVGYYSRKYPIAADQHFILKAVKSGASVRALDFVAGEHGCDGVSGVDYLGVITESFRVQVEVGFDKKLQTFLCCIRLLKNLFRS